MERWKILHSAKDLKQKRRDSERVVRMFRETHAISVRSSSTSYKNIYIDYSKSLGVRQKKETDSQCESVLLRSLTPARLIRIKQIASDEA